MILCDTNIFIEAFKNNPSATEMLRRIGFQNISLSAVTLMELYFGAFDKQELARIKSRMKNLETLILDRSITNAAINLIEQYSKSHGLQIPDALIAATAICKDMELLTYNIKNFKFIQDIKLFSDN